MVSAYMSQAEEAKQKLDRVSPCMCLAKWQQTSLHLTTGMTNSCYHPPLHPIDRDAIKTNPSALHNTDQKKQQRQQMVDGVRPEGCSYCWRMEDNGKMSDRLMRSGEPWAMQEYENILQNPQQDVVPTYVEVDFNSACNFKCSYCSPQFSTAWAQEVEDYGAYPTQPPHNDATHFEGANRVLPQKDNPYVEAFWQWWPDLYQKLKHFRMTGGEPMMDKNTYKVFDYVIANPKQDLHLNVTSNFCPPNSELGNRYFDKVKLMCDNHLIEHFMQFVSLDAWGSRAEYIRHGMDFNLLMDNVHRYLTDIPGRNSLTFIITLNNLAVSSLKSLMVHILELREKYSSTYQRVWFDTPVLRQPMWQHIGLLDQSFDEYFEEAIAYMREHHHNTDMAAFRDYEIVKMERAQQIMMQGVPDKHTHMANFWRFFRTHDARRQTDLINTFPEYRTFFGDCQQATQ